MDPTSPPASFDLGFPHCPVPLAHFTLMLCLLSLCYLVFSPLSCFRKEGLRDLDEKDDNLSSSCPRNLSSSAAKDKCRPFQKLLLQTDGTRPGVRHPCRCVGD